MASSWGAAGCVPLRDPGSRKGHRCAGGATLPPRTVLFLADPSVSVDPQSSVVRSVIDQIRHISVSARRSRVGPLCEPQELTAFLPRLWESLLGGGGLRPFLDGDTLGDTSREELGLPLFPPRVLRLKSPQDPDLKPHTGPLLPWGADCWGSGLGGLCLGLEVSRASHHLVLWGDR